MNITTYDNLEAYVIHKGELRSLVLVWKQHKLTSQLQMEMRLPPDKLDITPPHFLTDDNKEMYKDREAFLVMTFHLLFHFESVL